MKIKQKLTWGFISIALLVAVVGYISVNASQRALQKSIGLVSGVLAKEIVEQIDRNIYNRIEICQEYCGELEVQNIVSESNKEFEQIDNIQSYIDQIDRQWISTSKEKTTEFMRKLINNNELSQKLREKLNFYEEKNGYKLFGEIFVTNRYGANVAQTGKTSDYYQADENWWQEAKKNGIYVSDVEYDQSADVYSTDICIKVDDMSGNFAGVMKVVLNIEDVINAIKEKQVSSNYKTINIKLINKKGEMIYETKEHEIFEKPHEHEFHLFSEADHGYFVLTRQDEEEYLVAYAHSKGYKDYKGLDWILTVEYDTEEILAPVAKLRNLIVIISLLITTSAVFLGFLISKTIAGFIGKLVVAATEIGTGKLDTKVEIKSNDEIGQLADAFNKMAGDLQKTTASIGEINQEIIQRKKVEEQLQANEQYLKAANQQLEANEQQLKAANQQLQSEINQHEQTQKVLSNEKDKVQKYLDVVGVMVIVFDNNHKVQLINHKGCEILGCEEKDILHKDWCGNFVPEQARDNVRIVLSELLEGKIEQFEYHENPILNKDGEQRLIAWHNAVLYKEEGQIEAILSSGDDITERKQAQETTRRAREELEETNKKLKETQSQMVQNEKLASIGQLAAGVAHEMNTPVGFVASNFQTLESYIKKIRELLEIYNELTTEIETAEKTELLNKTNLINKFCDDKKIGFILEDIQDLFDDSREGIKRITGIIQNLRDFSRIDQSGSRDEYNLNDGINATLMVARNEIKYDADIETDFSEIPAVFCNSGQINQVFLNVLVNAAQAIKSQEKDKNGTIKVKTYATDEHVVCEICDDGPGIPPDKLSKIFDPFFTTKPVGKGTGLGLSVSYDIIVNKHNGELLVDSTLGKGAKFTIKLPINRTKENDLKEIIEDGKEKCVIRG